MSKKIKEPSQQAEQELNAIVENTLTKVRLGRRTVKVGAMTNELVRKLTDLALNERDESKVSTKSVAMIVLRKWWKIKLFYWFLWRWYYYVREYPEGELTAVIETAKKKLPLESYYRNTILLIGIRDTKMTMTREEVNRFLQEPHGGQPTI